MTPVLWPINPVSYEHVTYLAVSAVSTVACWLVHGEGSLVITVNYCCGCELQCDLTAKVKPSIHKCDGAFMYLYQS